MPYPIKEGVVVISGMALVATCAWPSLFLTVEASLFSFIAATFTGMFQLIIGASLIAHVISERLP